MSFGFTAIGDREQVTAQLRAENSDDSLKSGIADLLAEFVGKSALHGYESAGINYRQVYVVKASGHSGPQSSLSLDVSIEAPYVPVIDVDPQYKLTPAGESAAAEDSRQADVLAAIDKFEADLGFTAPELTGMRISELRSRVQGIFDPEQEEDGED